MPSASLQSLPLEIRQEIWRLCLEPRVVDIRWYNFGFASTTELPAVLTLCKESREAVLWLYPLSFGSLVYPPRTRFNFRLDTLYLGRELQDELDHFFGTLKEQELKTIRFLAINSDLMHWRREVLGDDTLDVIGRPLKHLTALKECIFVHDVCLLDMTGDLVFNVKDPIQLFNQLPEALRVLGLMEISILPEIPEINLRGVERREVYSWRKPLTGPILHTQV